MKPFQIVIELKSPIVVGKNSVCLDGLLWHCLYMHLHNPDLAKDALSQYLKLSKDGNYYHASSMQFGYLGEVRVQDGYVYDNLIATQRATVGVMRQGKDLSPTLFKPNGRNGKYTKLNLGGIPYKNRLVKHSAYFSRYVVFHGLGHGKQIAELIQFYVPALGVNASIGFGTIGKLYVKELATDLSIIGVDGKPARAIPLNDTVVQNIDSPRIENAILIPPFRNQETVPCVIPDRVRKLKITNPE